MQFPLRVYVQSALIALAIVPGAAAQYRIDTWTTENGLPQNSVKAIHQTRDSYLWLATFGGLVRFDGVSFTLFDGAGANGPSSSRVHTLYEARRGAIWIGTRGGVIRYHAGAFTAIATADGLPDNYVTAIREDPDGSMWVGTGYLWVGTNTGGLNRLKVRKLTAYGREQGLPGDGLVPVTEDRDGATIRLTLDVGASQDSHGSHDERDRHLKGDHGERRPDPARG